MSPKLSAVPNDVKRYSSEIADSIDKHFESVATAIRETLSNSAWLPESARPSPPRKISPPPLPPANYYTRAQEWVLKHKAAATIIITFIGISGVYLYKRKRAYFKKRRAKRASNGARKEVVGMSF
jgi:hypothetical protein